MWDWEISIEWGDNHTHPRGHIKARSRDTLCGAKPTPMASHEHSADTTATPMDQDEKKQKQTHSHEEKHGHTHSHEPGQEPALIVALGAVTLGGATFTIDRDGQVESGKTTEFGVELVGAPTLLRAGWRCTGVTQSKLPLRVQLDSALGR